jgi:acetyl esterase/lipase
LFQVSIDGDRPGFPAYAPALFALAPGKTTFNSTAMRTILILLAFPFLLFAESEQKLWPDGKTPHAPREGFKEVVPTLTAYLPSTEQKPNRCSVVVCPGGGYGGLALGHEGKDIATFFNEQGITVFILKYRLGSQGYHFPTQLADVQRAMRTARSQADALNLDPQRIGIMGFSAGGHLASMAATKFNETAYPPSDDIDAISARPDFAILCYPVITMEEDFTHKGSRNNLLGPDKKDDATVAMQLSSEKNVTAETPPTFIFQTDADGAVPAENPVQFYLALRKHKIPAEMHIYQKGGHGVGLAKNDAVLSTWPGHLLAWLRVNKFISDEK